MRRADTLDKAKMIVTGERNQEYGGPESTFGSIAKLWSAYLEVDIAAEDVAVLMILLKVARLAGSAYSSADSWVDIAGYAACGSEISGCEETAAGSKASEEIKKSNDELREKLAAWHSVEDELPPDTDSVLVWVPDGKWKSVTFKDCVLFGSYDPDGWMLDDYPEAEELTITHWMELPEGPEGKR